MSKFSKSIVIAIISCAVITVCLAILWYLKPQQSEGNSSSVELATAQQYMQQQPTVKPHAEKSDTVTNAPSVTTVAQEQQLLQQRDAMYVELGQIAMQMMEGQKPDLRHVSALIQQHHMLVQKGVISLSDAQTDVEFWGKVFPEMSHELHIYTRQLHQIAAKTTAHQ